MGVNGGTRLDNVAEEHLLLHDDERACLAVAHALNRLGYLDYRVSDGLKNIVLPALEDKAETREFALAQPLYYLPYFLLEKDYEHDKNILEYYAEHIGARLHLKLIDHKVGYAEQHKALDKLERSCLPDELYAVIEHKGDEQDIEQIGEAEMQRRYL